MRICVKDDKTAAEPQRRRFLVLWGRPNIGGSRDWFIAALTPVVTITGASEAFNALWATVPKGLSYRGAIHPSLRVSVRPETLSGPTDEPFFTARMGTVGMTQTALDSVHPPSPCLGAVSSSPY